jgi:hypothetical protein
MILRATCFCFLKDVKLMDAVNQPCDESVRQIERGSRIVLLIPQDVSLILQVSSLFYVAVAEK